MLRNKRNPACNCYVVFCLELHLPLPCLASPLRALHEPLHRLALLTCMSLTLRGKDVRIRRYKSGADVIYDLFMFVVSISVWFCFFAAPEPEFSPWCPRAGRSVCGRVDIRWKLHPGHSRSETGFGRVHQNPQLHHRHHSSCEPSPRKSR
jgi:hypothetical protein